MDGGHEWTDNTAVLMPRDGAYSQNIGDLSMGYGPKMGEISDGCVAARSGSDGIEAGFDNLRAGNHLRFALVGSFFELNLIGFDCFG